MLSIAKGPMLNTRLPAAATVTVRLVNDILAYWALLSIMTETVSGVVKFMFMMVMSVLPV